MKENLGKTFIVDLFPSGGKKESKYEERTLFWGSPPVLTCFLILSLRKMHICFLRTNLVIAFFWPLPDSFRN